MNLSQITLMARIFEILRRAPKPLEVHQINCLIANERWRGKWWHVGGVSRQQITQLLRRMARWGLTRQTSSGWAIAESAPDVTSLCELIFASGGEKVGTGLRSSSAKVAVLH